ncbi:MAG TPA: DHA2 family efflux MFS transporter permease subunit [Terracidiphilus sp.]|nr:DHA2 family efflux MFS transporter permease subunit [Terracidiphilus sp.]
MSTDGAAQKPEIDHRDWRPSVNPWTVAVSVMLATFMVVLDSSVANVALPHIAGNLSASTDESTWVLTSYLVSNAIMLPASGWIARRIGRKRLMMFSILLFTIASLLCGLSLTMPMLIVARVLQGVGGGGMQPLAQSILLESFPPEKHGTAMAVYGMGIVVAPVIGPTLGGWITDSFSWRWIFYINLPVGLLALFMANLFIEDPPYLRKAFHGKIDYLGFSLMAVWLGTLQLVLDKGQEADWFAAGWIRWVTAASVIALIGFVLREFLSRDPIVQLRVLADRNFGVGTLIAGIYGFVLYGMTALLPLFLQTLLGYPALDSGLAVSPRGIGSIVSMLVVGALVNRIDGRVLLGTGFLLLSYSTFLLSRINLDISMSSVVWPNVMNGFAGGFIFVPLTTMTMSRLRKEQIGNAAGIYNLMRNIGGSIGIASVTTMLVRGSQIHQSYLAANLTATNPDAAQALLGLQEKFHISGASANTAYLESLGALYRSVQQQASLLAYADNFRLMAFLMLFCIPLVWFFHRLRLRSRGRVEADDAAAFKGEDIHAAADAH